MGAPFFVSVFNSRIMRYQIERAISGADGLANNLPQSSLREFCIPMPPVSEQDEIATHINSECRTFEELIAQSEASITLLQERRTALISAAVTGQIDVRNAA